MGEPFHLVSYLAANSFWYFREVAAFLERQFGIPTDLIQADDPLRDEPLPAEQVTLAFICGLPLMRLNRQQVRLEAIVAPVMQAKRYQDLPIYFADVIIRADSELRDFDLRDVDQWSGRVFCYNDAGSNSGYHLVQQYLAKQGYGPEFMARSMASGSHQTSIAWVVEGKADWAAIDSTVLEQEFRDQPWLKPRLRVVKSLGPCPIPPIAVAAGVPQALKQQLQAALLQPDARLLTAMHRAGIGRYADVSLLNYQGLERNEP